MSGHRQAAAALYGLARADQDGILAELAERDQRILRGYLAELSEMGFDRTVTTAPLTGTEPAAQPPFATAGAVESDPRSRLRGAGASEVFAVVAHEPAALIAQLLVLEVWPWAEAILDMLPPARSTQVQIAIDAGPCTAPARAQFLVDALSARLADRVAAPSGARLAHLPQALRKWLPWTR
jgi:hypothetical protein